MLIEEEDDEDPVLALAVQPDADDYFPQFPCAYASTYIKAVHDMPHHIQASLTIEPDLVPSLSAWLEGLPDPSLDSEAFYFRKASFWDAFSSVASKILFRRHLWMNAINGSESNHHSRYPFGDAFDDLSTDDIFDRFLAAYLRVCSFLLLVDAQYLVQQPAGHVLRLSLLSSKHMRSLHNIVRYENSAVLLTLHKQCGADVRERNVRMPKEFLRASGAQNLLRMLDAAFHRVPQNLQHTYATYASQLLSTLGWIIFDLPGEDTFMETSHFHRGVLSYFQTYGAELFDPSLPIDSGIARDLILYHGTLVQDLCYWDESIASKLADQLLDFGDLDAPTMAPPANPTRTGEFDYRRDPICYPLLVSSAYKFKVLRKYITKGNMALRVMSIAIMDTALVEVWQEFSKTTHRHPVMQYLADFLLQGQVVDYIVSVDSHPQLISRSGNIAGFLIMAHRWSDDRADAIWKNVSSSPDSRVVAATMTMLRNITHLMTLSDRLYLCTKLYDLSLDRWNLDILRFFRTLTTSLNENGNSYRSIESEGRGPTARPWSVLVRVIRETAPSRHADKNLLDLQHEAFEQFRYLAAAIPPDQRSAMYRECAQQIAAHSDTATGNYRIFCLMVHPDDNDFFEHNPDLIRSALGEIPKFVEQEVLDGPYPWQIQALSYRIELIRLTITHPFMSIPNDLYQSLWDHIVGDKALSNQARDLAWLTLVQSNRTSPGSDFCKQLVSSYIPNMDSCHYTPGLFDFVASYSFPLTRKTVQTEQGTDTSLQIPGADVLWLLILSAPSGTIEERAARVLATRYVKVIEDPVVTLVEVEKAHIELVDQCMRRLRAAIRLLQRRAGDETSYSQEPEVIIRRILLFQKILLECVRQKPELNRGRRVDSKVDAMDTDLTNGEAITIRYQYGNNRHRITMSSEHTVDDLYRKLCHVTGFTKVNLFARGQRLKVFEQEALKLSEIELGGQVIVQRADGAEPTRPLPDLTAGSSVFETAVVEHFNELFSWMDSGNDISYQLFEFLTLFPTRTFFADNVAQGKASSEDLFPAGKVYQARYAALALQSRLREQIHDSALDENFLGNAVQSLVKVLVNSELAKEPVSDPQQLHLPAVIVSVLLDFLRERPTPDISATYFSEEAIVIDRLMRIISIALTTPNSAPVAQDAYAAILEASLHSKAIWEAFTGHPDVSHTHQLLLLAQPQQRTREYVARKISSLCGGDLPSSCPITRAETASRFWTILSAILPKATLYSEQSKELFEIAEHVFRVNDEYDRNEAHLRSLLAQWSALLLGHEHDEIPGRHQSDYIVFGMTRLILCCILSIKSFKKPINAGSLMAEVFKKYIFVNSTRTVDASQRGTQLPILQSHTRQELYDLVLGLAEDQSTYSTLLQLSGEIEHDDTDSILPSNLVDRAMEIRSSTGYVGLYNPRAICYMNSLLTQLFMNLNFRQFIFDFKVDEGTRSQRLLFETQRLFAQMQNSFRKSTDPREFAACVKSLDKMPIDITVQMDADEFYNLLFDQWEAQMFKAEHKLKFRAFYGGQTMNQIKSKECEHVSERIEPFFAVQCDIAGKATLQESLQAYVQGDVMEGDNKYKCESCGGKFVDAVKRTCLKDAPDNLIFHLKRFEFDLNDFSRKKIYDHFAFPDTLDISPYKFDHLAEPDKPRTADLFDLVGVLVHTGTCENGHYYSYIRQRPSASQSGPPTWVEFNDSEVTPFDPANIADRTFGGFTDGDAYNRQIKQFSAYMLFYQRRSAIEKDQQHWMTEATGRTPQISVPKFFEEEMNVNNKDFIREYSLFDPAHAKFVRQLHGVARTVNHGVCSEEHHQEARALHIVLSHLGRIAWRQNNAEIPCELLLYLRRIIMSCSACCCIALRWLAEDEHTMTNMLIRCTHPRLRTQMRALLIDSLRYLRDKEPTNYGLETSDSDLESDSTTAVEGVVVALIRRLRNTADDTFEGTRGWEDYYLLLTQMAEFGHLEAAVMLNHGFLFFCLKLFCMNAHQPFRNDCPELARIMEKRKGTFNRLTCFLWKLLSHTDLRLEVLGNDHIHDRLPTLDRECMKFPLSAGETAAVTYWSNDIRAFAVIDKILELFDDRKTDHFYPGDIVTWMLESPDENVQKSLARTMIEGIEMEPPHCDAYIQAALPFCEGCQAPENIVKAINAVARTIGSPDRVDDRSPSGDAVLRLFFGLLTAENKTFFARRNPHAFRHCLMARSNQYGPAMLCHYEEYIRKTTQTFFQKLFGTDGATVPETMMIKYKSSRALLSELMHRFIYEREVGRHRSFMGPLMNTCRFLVTQLYTLSRSHDPELQQFQHADDAALICQFQQEIETLMVSWPHNVGTPMSQGEAYQSDYVSESDDGRELVEN